MPDLARIGIRTPIYGAVREDDAAADAGRQGHVKDRQVVAAGSIESFAECAGIGVVVHDGLDVDRIFNESRQVEVAPAAHVRGEDDALPVENHRPAEADSAALDGGLTDPIAGEGLELTEHPFASAFAIGRARFTADHAVA